MENLSQWPVGVRIPVAFRQRLRPVDIDQHRQAGSGEFPGEAVCLLAAIDDRVQAELFTQAERAPYLGGA